MATADRVITNEELSKHSLPTDAWVAVDGHVYNVTKFQNLHPGGGALLRAVAGKDASEEFFALHRREVLKKYERLRVGSLPGASASQQKESGDKQLTSRTTQEKLAPYSESSFWLGWHSPYFTESHDRFRVAVRAFVDEVLAPVAASLDDSGEEPSLELYRQLAKAGILAIIMGPGEALVKFCHKHSIALPGGVKPEEVDPFHVLILQEELRRLGTYGFNDGLVAGIGIGLPPLVHFGSTDMFERIATPILLGEKRICLAISDPMAGSDVAGMMATATTTPDGGYLVNGLKKWITGGNFADYFTVAVRTETTRKDGKKQGGVSLLVVERSEGVTTTPIKTSSSLAAGTSLVVFENAKVDRANLIGREGHGFSYVMANFNTERWGMCVSGNRHARLIVEECIKWASQRKVFGKPLIQQPVIRNKLAHMIGEVEAVNNWIENVTYQMCKMKPEEQGEKLAGPIALLKLRQTRAATLVSDEACQIFGGRAVTKSGMGQQVERFQRTFKFHSILGGSEEIMADLGVRQALKYWDGHSKL